MSRGGDNGVCQQGVFGAAAGEADGHRGVTVSVNHLIICNRRIRAETLIADTILDGCKQQGTILGHLQPALAESIVTGILEGITEIKGGDLCKGLRVERTHLTRAGPGKIDDVCGRMVGNADRLATGVNAYGPERGEGVVVNKCPSVSRNGELSAVPVGADFIVKPICTDSFSDFLSCDIVDAERAI